MYTLICLARTQSGTPISGCVARFVAAQDEDKTLYITQGHLLLVTGPDGYYRNQVAEGATDLPPGAYRVLANATGYATYDQPFYHGGGPVLSITIVMTPESVDEAGGADYFGASFVSPMYPVEVILPRREAPSAWELLETTVTDSNGNVRVIEVRAQDETTTVNLQARLALKPVPHLVADGQLAMIDPDFSTSIIATFASLTKNGSLAIPGQLSLSVANAFPDIDAESNDLTPFTNQDGLANWLTPWNELPKFVGNYSDAMIWLTMIGQGNYTLTTQFQNINRQLISTNTDQLPAEVFATGQVVRVRIPEPIAGAYYALLTISQGDDVQTHPLTVKYVHG
jgi:hypothetical protein